MKPRQTVKNYHHNSKTMFPCHNNQNSSASSNNTLTQALRDLDLAKLGLNLEDLPNLQAPPPTTTTTSGGQASHQLPHQPPLPNITSQNEIVKCLQAIYGNKNTNEIMQKLPLKLNDWAMQSVCPPDYSRVLNNSGGDGVSGGGGCASGVTSSSNTTTAGLASGAAGFGGGGGSNSGVSRYLPFNNNLPSIPPPPPPPTQPSLNNNANKALQQIKQDPKLASGTNSNSSNSLQHHLHQNPSTINPHFKMSTTNTQQQPQQHHHASTQQKSVFDTTSSSSSSSSSSSIVRHQHLQKLLKASGQSQKTSSSPSQIPANSRKDTFSMPANIQPTSQTTTFSTVPKSLLNLAACTSSSPSSSSINATSSPSSNKLSTMVNQLSRKLNDGIFDKQFGKNPGGVIVSGVAGSINNSTVSDNSISNSNKTTNLADLALMNSSTPQSLIKLSSSNNSSSLHLSNSSRSSLKHLHSLMPDEQLPSPPTIRANSRTTCNLNSYNPSKQSSSSSMSHQKINSLNLPSTSKEVFLAELHERAARTGISIGEITKPVHSSSSSYSTSSTNPATSVNTTSTSVIISPSQSLLDEHTNLVGRREIESALSRVEARNDLSLLYPPMLLADNSQKQINALSAGFPDTEDMELFTKEVKKIVLEECNIIYECKECSNLFRSLANLVKHKRTYCLEQSVERNNIDMNKRTGVSLLSPTDNNAPITTNDISSPNYYYPLQKQPNLSKLLRNQPKHRLPSSRDSVLKGALTMSNLTATDNDPLAAFESDKTTLEVHEQLVRSSSLAKTLLDEKAKAIRPKQSLIELSKAESMHKRFGLAGNNSSSGSTATKRAAPKRKFLEDCIRKVKRDRINNEDDEESVSEFNLLRPSQTFSSSPIRNSLLEKEIQSSHQDMATFNNTDNSDQESDILMIDLEEPKRKEDAKIDKRRPSTAAYSSASSSSSVKMNSSSALLKALTRPIAKKPIQSVTSTEPKSTTEDSKEQPKPSEFNSSPNEQVSGEQSVPNEQNQDEIKLEKSSGDVVDADDDVNEEKTTDTDPDPSVNAIVDGNANEEEDVAGEGGADGDGDDDEDTDPEDSVDEEVSENSSSPLFAKHTCDLCEVDYDDFEALRAHSADAHPCEKLVYLCIYCSFSCTFLENVCHHILDIHKKPMEQVHILKEVVRSRAYISNDFRPPTDYSSDSERSGVSEPPKDYESNSSLGSNRKPSSSNSSKDIDLQESKTTPTKAGSASADLNTSGSSSTAAGGIMKLKIQLKTRPDEKSKVYEIV